MPHDDQFTATGPAFTGAGFERAAFSTGREGTDSTYGVNVQGSFCGVYGESGPVSDRIADVPGVGVFGSGQNFGVFGKGVPNGGIAGVFGQHNRGGVGIIGAAMRGGTGIVGTSVSSLGNPLTLLNAAGGSGTGVFGKSGSGLGVHGVSESNTAVFGKSGSGFGVHGDSESNTAVFGKSGSGIGAHGDSDGSTGVLGTSESGFGVHGRSDGGPGGVFESKNNAQIRLLPREMASPEGQVAGAGGELLATTAAGVSGPLFRLWFCTRAGDAASAAWDLVAGRRPFPGAQVSEGATGIEVKRIQMRLNMVFGTDLNGDGEFGPITRDAVVAFQAQEQIGQTGVVDADTWERLFALS